VCFVRPAPVFFDYLIQGVSVFNACFCYSALTFYAAMFKIFKSSGKMYCFHPSMTVLVSQGEKPVKMVMEFSPPPQV
jgi:hypothetical protein